MYQKIAGMGVDKEKSDKKNRLWILHDGFLNIHCNVFKVFFSFGNVSKYWIAK